MRWRLVSTFRMTLSMFQSSDGCRWHVVMTTRDLLSTFQHFSHPMFCLIQKIAQLIECLLRVRIAPVAAYLVCVCNLRTQHAACFLLRMLQRVLMTHEITEVARTGLCMKKTDTDIWLKRIDGYDRANIHAFLHARAYTIIHTHTTMTFILCILSNIL